MSLRSNTRCLLAFVFLTGLPAGAALTTFTYTGAAPDPGNWNNESNWVTGGITNGYPTQAANAETLAVIPDGKSPVFTSGTVGNLYRLQTGNGLVVFANGGLSCHDATPYSPSITIGSGGCVITGSVYTSRGPFIANGNIRITGNLQTWQQGITQNAGTFDFGGNIILGEQADATLPAWMFSTPFTGTVRIASIYNNHTVTMTGTPNFGGGRPDILFIQGGDGGGTWNISSQSLLADDLTIGNWPGAPGRFGRLLCNGGALDINTLAVNYNGAGWTSFNYLSLTNCTVTLRGSGTAWSVQTIGNSNFSMRANTTLVLDPAAGSLNVDTGSKDRNSGALDPVDWQNNFAFDVMQVGSGDTVTLTGDANIEGGGVNALYAFRLVGLGGGGTLRLNGHNVYLLRRPENVTFDTTGGGRVYFPKSGTIISIR